MIKMFCFLLVIILISVGIAIVYPNTEDKICGTSSKTFGRSDCVVTAKCPILDKLAYQGEVVHCGIDTETGSIKICCPKSSNVRQVKASATKNPYEIVRRKCFQYSSARYITITSPPSLPSMPNITQRIMPCSFPVFYVVKGNFADAREFPHMAAIGFTTGLRQEVNDSLWRCSGTLISDRYVLTAAHCQRFENYEPRWVRLGDLNLQKDNDDAQPQDFAIMERIPHPEYRKTSMYYDIMLLKLQDRVVFTTYMRPICLYWSPVLVPALHNEAIITGWGATGADERQSDALLKAKVEFTEDDECVKHENYKSDRKLARGYDPRSMVCAGSKEHGRDACFGDSGGPLQVPFPKWACMYSQVGITSYGSKICGQKNVSSIYTKVSTFIPWIQSIVWP